MNHLLAPRPDEQPSFQIELHAYAPFLIAIICYLGLLLSLCAAIFGLDLGASSL
jgi:hypothetical protein